MSGRIVLRMDAVQDMKEQFDWLATQSRSLAVRFLDAVRATQEELAENSDLGIRWEFPDTNEFHMRCLCGSAQRVGIS